MWNLKEKAKSSNLETMATFSLQTLFLIHSDPQYKRKGQKIPDRHFCWKLWEAAGERLRKSLPKWGGVCTAPTAAARSEPGEQPRGVSAPSAPGLCESQRRVPGQLVNLPWFGTSPSGSGISDFGTRLLPRRFHSWTSIFSFVSVLSGVV